MNMETGKTEKLCSVFFAVMMAAVTGFLIWKAPYGFHMSDEAFYLATPYRYLQGDALLAEEWFPTLFSSFLLCPLLRLYLLIKPTTEGIIVNFRYIYVFFHILTAVFIYCRLVRRSPVAAAGAALAYALYTPYNIMALSYNSMGAAFALLSVLILGTAEKKKAGQIGGVCALPRRCCAFPILRWYILPALRCGSFFRSVRRKLKGSGTGLILRSAFLSLHCCFSCSRQEAAVQKKSFKASPIY